MLSLDRPIPARAWRRFTFLYTTGERLRLARDVKQLTLQGSAREGRRGRRLRENGSR
jgi:hypothetical protein